MEDEECGEEKERKMEWGMEEEECGEEKGRERGRGIFFLFILGGCGVFFAYFVCLLFLFKLHLTKGRKIQRKQKWRKLDRR